MSSSSSLASKSASMNGSDEEQEESEEMLPACVLVGEKLKEKDIRPKYHENCLGTTLQS